MQSVHENKKIKQFELDLSEILEHHLIDAPTHIILEMCDNEVCNKDNRNVADGEIFVMNFIENGIEIKGTITSTNDQVKKENRFNLGSKENCSFYGWHYSTYNKIILNATVKLLSGEEIDVIINEAIDFPSRSKLLIFYT